MLPPTRWPRNHGLPSPSCSATGAGGSREAFDTLLPLVHAELHRLARLYMARERGNHTLQPTALVNEAYLKLVGERDMGWQSRAHFVGVAAQLMRNILADLLAAQGFREARRRRQAGDARRQHRGRPRATAGVD